ncbi:transposable element Tcb1 transposase [Trichonephila clavipes]|nr:transposable element Tcb1 transposase [Trichonephila clavipes]
MSRRKQRSAFDQVSEFDRGRIVAYRDCGLSYREIDSRVGRDHTTVMRICDRWMQEVPTWSIASTSVPATSPLTQNQGVSAANGAMKDRCGRQNGMKLSLLTSHASVCNITMVGFESGTPWREDSDQLRYAPHTGPAPDIMVWGGIEYHSRFSLVRIAGTLNSQRYISEMLEPGVLPYFQGLSTAIF